MDFVPDAFIFGFIQGFVIGPITLYSIQEGLNPQRGPWFQAQVILGATLVDITYMLLATYGIAHFIDQSWIKTLMWVGASYMLLHMGLNSLREKITRMSFHHMRRRRLKFYETDFVKGILMDILNPVAIVFAIMVVGSLYATYQGPANPLSFVLSISTGGLMTSAIFVVATYALGRLFRPSYLQKIIHYSSFVLIGYGVYFGFKALIEAQPVLATIATRLF